MIIEKSEQIVQAVGSVLLGKEETIQKVLMAIYAKGHILLEDNPGVGKTTLALAFSKVLGLEYGRIQFTSDTMPSDITGYSVYNKETRALEYKPGATDCQLFLGDEINRTSPKTQAALLEVMEEGNITVDGITHHLKTPFICIATQNPTGSVGTQPLPDSQLDRFMVRISIGYPGTEEQIAMIRQRQHNNPLADLKPVVSAEDILHVQDYLSTIKMTDGIVLYMIALCDATHTSPMVELGVSPRGLLALSRMARARAVLNERSYVVPEDVRAVFIDVCAHRMILKPQARIEGYTASSILKDIMDKVASPAMGEKSVKI